MPDSDATPPARAERSPIWSVSERTRAIYFVLFSAFYASGLALLVIFGDGGDPARSIPEKVIAYWGIAGAMALAAAAAAMILAESGGTVMVFLDRAFEARDRQREEFRAEGFVKGRTEERREWMDWYARMQKARAEGRAFDDPPPALEANGASERSA